MIRYTLRRVGWTILVLWAIVSLTFVATFLSPIDPARSYAGLRASKQVIAEVRRQFGLNEPRWVQYGRYIERLLHGNLGHSYATGQSVFGAVLGRLPYTAELAIAAMLVQITLGLPLGVAAALYRGRPLDRGILSVSLLGVVTPTFVLGYLLLYVFAFKLAWFPLGGTSSFAALVLPAVTLGVGGAAWYTRMLRSTVLNIVGEDYVRTARSRGLPERLVIWRHVLRNAIGPLITMIGIDLGVFLGGVLVVEKVFDWPGIGEQAWNAISFNDVPMVMGTVLVAAFFITILNLAADLVNAVIDPRVRYSGTAGGA
jgi:peptide/nickel transport system permease protein